MDQQFLDRLAKHQSLNGYEDIKVILKGMKRVHKREKTTDSSPQHLPNDVKHFSANMTPTSRLQKAKDNLTVSTQQNNYFSNNNVFILAETPKSSHQIQNTSIEADDSKFRSTNKSFFRQTSEAFKNPQRQLLSKKSSQSMVGSFLPSTSQSKFYTPQTPTLKNEQESSRKKNLSERLNSLSIGGDIFSPTVPTTVGVFKTFKEIIDKHPKNLLEKFFDTNVPQQDKIKKQLTHNSLQMSLIKEQQETERITSFENFLFTKQYTDNLMSKSGSQKKVPHLMNLTKNQKSNFNQAVFSNNMHKFQSRMSQMNFSLMASNSGFPQQSNSQIEEQVSAEQIQNQIEEYQFHWEKISNYQSDLKPEFREGATLVEYKQSLYLYGGFGAELFGSLYQYKLRDYKWKKIQTFGTTVPGQGRFGHSANLYKNQMIVFGGGTEFSSKMKNRFVMNELWMLNFENFEWKQLRTTGDYIEPRRNHAACIVGNNYFVHGGVGSYEKYVNQLGILQLDKGRWKSMNLKMDEQGIAFHKLVPIFSKYIKYQSSKSENMGQIVSQKNKFKIKEEGIYCFGGKLGNEKIRGKLIILKLDDKDMPLDWMVPETGGMSPPPRFHHSMFYNYHIKGIVVFGGTNDEANISQPVYQDVWILSLITLNWTQVNVSGQANKYRFAHAYTSIDERLFVFGGASNNSYTDCELYILEMNKEQALQKKNNPIRDMFTRQLSLDRLEEDEIDAEPYQERNKTIVRRKSGVKTFLRPPTKDQLKMVMTDDQANTPQERSRKNTIFSLDSTSPRASSFTPRLKGDATSHSGQKGKSLFSQFI